MEIERQSDTYGGFEGRIGYVPEPREAPAASEVAEFLGGRRITPGLNNRREAVNTNGMDPAEHAYHGMPDFQPHDEHDRWAPAGQRWERGDGGQWEAPGYVERAQEEASEGIDADDASGYNWGPEPHGIANPGFSEGRGSPFDTPTYSPGGGYEDFDRAQGDWEHQRGHEGRCLTAASLIERQKRRKKIVQRGKQRQQHLFAAMPAQPVMDPGAAMLPGHMYAPGHRIGLPYRDMVIPGTVTHLDGNNVGVRWDDGQHSLEEPRHVQPL